MKFPKRFFEHNWTPEERKRFNKMMRDEMAREDAKMKLTPKDLCSAKFSQAKYSISADGSFASIKVRMLGEKEEFVHTLVDIDCLDRAVWHTLFARKKGNQISVRVSCKKQPNLGRFILGITSHKLYVSYANGDSLDNRIVNLVVKTKGADRGRQIGQEYGTDWPKARDEAMDRANGICQRCRKERAIHVHHKLPVRFFEVHNDANFPENLMAVCRSCHRLEHIDIKRNMPLLNQIRFKKIGTT